MILWPESFGVGEDEQITIYSEGATYFTVLNTTQLSGGLASCSPGLLSQLKTPRFSVFLAPMLTQSHTHMAFGCVWWSGCITQIHWLVDIESPLNVTFLVGFATSSHAKAKQVASGDQLGSGRWTMVNRENKDEALLFHAASSKITNLWDIWALRARFKNSH